MWLETPQSAPMLEKLISSAVAERRGVQEAGERRQVAHQPLGRDFLPEIVGDVGVETPRRRGGLDHSRQVAVVQHAGQVEAVADLGRGQPPQLEPQRAPTEEIRGAPPHLPGARSAQREMDAAVLDQPMHLVEQGRRLLDLVDHHLPARRGPGRLDLLAQPLRVGHVAAELVHLEQVDPTCVRVTLPQQRRLAGLARTPQEERVLARWRERQVSFEHQSRIIMTI